MSFSIENYQKAFMFAVKAHKEQKTLHNYPYITHIVLVTSEIIDASFYEEYNQKEIDTAISCALLHDTIEDTEIIYEDIYVDFGKEVADGVLALSKNEKIVKEYRMIDSLERLLKQPKHIQMVKLADRITNLSRPSGMWSRQRKLAYQQETKIIYDYLSASSEYLAKKLEKKIQEYSKYI